MTIRILLVEDHALVRTGFKLLLSTDAALQIVAQAESGEQAYSQYVEHQPDVVIMDLSMPGQGGVESIKHIIARDKRARILALSAHEDISYPKRALQAGALGYLSKRNAAEALIDAVKAVAQGKSVIDPQIAQRLVMEQVRGASHPIEQLSEREFAVFIQLAKGHSVAAIAKMLSISSSTVGTHVYNIKQKLAVSNHAEMTLIAVRRGLIDS
jgi:two-component system, NarL family, invasion response regulator UvrY